MSHTDGASSLFRSIEGRRGCYSCFFLPPEAEPRQEIILGTAVCSCLQQMLREERLEMYPLVSRVLRGGTDTEITVTLHAAMLGEARLQPGKRHERNAHTEFYVLGPVVVYGTYHLFSLETEEEEHGVINAAALRGDPVSALRSWGRRQRLVGLSNLKFHDGELDEARQLAAKADELRREDLGFMFHQEDVQQMEEKLEGWRGSGHAAQARRA